MRWLRRLLARILNYLSVPCPACGRYYAGHDPDDPHVIYHGRLVCPRCARGRCPAEWWPHGASTEQHHHCSLDAGHGLSECVCWCGNRSGLVLGKGGWLINDPATARRII